MNRLLHKLLYRILPLGGYLQTVSAMFFLSHRLGIGRHAPATEYTFHLDRLMRAGDLAIDIGANLGYYARLMSRIAGRNGHVYAVEPVAPIRRVLERNLSGCGNVDILPYALGAAEGEIRMGNATVRTGGYFGTGQNFVMEAGAEADVEFTAEMRRGSELFGHLTRIDFIKCDVEGYEVVIMEEMRPLLERFRPTVLIETGGENRDRIVALFTELGYDAYTLHRGQEIPLRAGSKKDIIFRPKKNVNCQSHAYRHTDRSPRTAPLAAQRIDSQTGAGEGVGGDRRPQSPRLRPRQTENHRRLPLRRRSGHGDEARTGLRTGGETPSRTLYDEIVYTSPDGMRYDQHEANRLSTLENIIVLCGHYKGIDHRIREHLITREISIGDYVLTGGDWLPA